MGISYESKVFLGVRVKKHDLMKIGMKKDECVESFLFNIITKESLSVEYGCDYDDKESRYYIAISETVKEVRCGEHAPLSIFHSSTNDEILYLMDKKLPSDFKWYLETAIL
jgi:hypothetical protein